MSSGAAQTKVVCSSQPETPKHQQATHASDDARMLHVQTSAVRSVSAGCQEICLLIAPRLYAGMLLMHLLSMPGSALWPPAAAAAAVPGVLTEMLLSLCSQSCHLVHTDQPPIYHLLQLPLGSYLCADKCCCVCSLISPCAYQLLTCHLLQLLRGSLTCVLTSVAVSVQTSHPVRTSC
jgi:hypothetical protein